MARLTIAQSLSLVSLANAGRNDVVRLVLEFPRRLPTALLSCRRRCLLTTRLNVGYSSNLSERRVRDRDREASMSAVMLAHAQGRRTAAMEKDRLEGGNQERGLE